MLEIFALLSILIAFILLTALSYIDLKEGLLPNEMVLGLVACGMIFHLSLLFYYLDMPDMALGAFIGGGLLYVIRGVSNHFYQEDALGLGDVKLMAAGGIWLGPEGILIAMTVGAFAGFLHGAFVAINAMRRAGVKTDLTRFSIPAGPGFAVGIVATGIYIFRDLPVILLP